MPLPHLFNIQSPATNTSWMMIEKIYSMGIGFFVGIFVAKHLGPEHFGVLSFLTALIALAAPLSSLGLNALVSKEVIQYPEERTKIISTAFFFRLFASVFSSIVLILIIVSGIAESIQPWLIWSIVLCVSNVGTASQVIDYWFQSQLMSRTVTQMKILVLTLISVGKLYLVLSGSGLSLFIAITAAETLILGMGFIFIYLRSSGKISLFSVDISYGKKIVSQSKWLIFSGIASVIYLKIDQIMLAEMVSMQAVGIYSVASRLSEVWYFFPTALVASFLPALIKAKENAAEQYKNKLQSLCDQLFLMSISLAVLTIFFAESLILFLFGEAYLGAADVLVVHIWAGVFIFMRALLSKWLIIEELTRYSLLTHGAGAIFNVLLNLFLIPQYGALGAAYATVISYACSSYIALFVCSETRPMALFMTKSIILPMRFMQSRFRG